MFSVGRMCLKIAGRDAGKKCVVVETIDNNNVLIDGQTRRRKCNVNHLEPLKKTVDIASGADSKTVQTVLEKEGVVFEKKGDARKAADKPKKQHMSRKKK